MRMISKAAKYLNRRNMGIAFRMGDIPREPRPYAPDSVQWPSNRKHRRMAASKERKTKGEHRDNGMGMDRGTR